MIGTPSTRWPRLNQQSPIVPDAILLALAMYREQLHRSSIAQLSSLRLSRVLTGTSLVLFSIVLFEWDMSLKTWVSIAAFACALFSFYQGTLAGSELKRRERPQPDHHVIVDE